MNVRNVVVSEQAAWSELIVEIGRYVQNAPIMASASLLVLAMAAISAPTEADVQAFEELRILEPLADYDHDVEGRGFIAFGPTVETRNVSCVLVADESAVCSYESRTRDFLSDEFSHWELRQERMVWRKGRWLRPSNE